MKTIDLLARFARLLLRRTYDKDGFSIESAEACQMRIQHLLLLGLRKLIVQR